MESKRSKRTPKDTLTDLILEFIEAAVHEFLFAWRVYPKESFEQRVLYDVPVHMNRYPVLCEYIQSMLAGCRAWIYSGEIEKFCVVILSEEGRTMDTLVIETKWNSTSRHADATTAVSEDDESHELPLVHLEEAFRTALVALIATPLSTNSSSSRRGSLKPNSFRILAHTNEDMAKPGTSVDEGSAGNSWVLADPFWYEDESKQEDEKYLLPVRAKWISISVGRSSMALELVVSGYDTEEKKRVGICELSEKYAPLGVKEFAVVELRGNETGAIEAEEGVCAVADRAVNWITVYFQDDEFEFCDCLFGARAVKTDLRD